MSLYDTRKLAEKYKSDPAFAVVVDAIYHMIGSAQLPPEELRQAFFVAQWKFDTQHIRPIIIISDIEQQRRGY